MGSIQKGQKLTLLWQISYSDLKKLKKYTKTPVKDRKKTKATKKTEQDAVKAEDMRRKSFETFGETMKQKSVDNDEKQSTSKRRNTGSEMPKYVQVKAESEMAIRQQEIARDVLGKKVFLKILQNLQENICARVSFLIRLQARGLEHFWVTASGYELVLFDSFE